MSAVNTIIRIIIPPSLLKMCGIVGFTGTKQAAPILLDGLSKLEYRGYDSAGIAVRDGDKDTEIIKPRNLAKSVTVE